VSRSAAGRAGGLLAVIPARGGSKRIPGKNVRPLAGRPVLEYTVEAALASGLFAAVVVTTDSPTIADVARRAGAAVPFLRSAALAGDDVPVSSATTDVLRRLDPTGTDFTAVAQLMPNCPLRNAEDVRASYRQFGATGAESQLSVVRFGWQNPWWALERDSSMRLAPLFGDRITAPSQDLPPLYCPTGAIWWAQAAVLRSEGTFHIAGRTGWEIPWERGVDVDTEEDWRMLELLHRLEQPQGVPAGA
jgi:CMP-N-acetylneuraminic acid synthetase